MDKHKQIAAQCRAVAHLAKQLAAIYDDLAPSLDEGAFPLIHDMIGLRTASQMEILGDMLNGMDAVEDGDAWIDPIFEEAQRLYPDAVKRMGWFGPYDVKAGKLLTEDQEHGA